jgi:hypothetical protein
MKSGARFRLHSRGQKRSEVIKETNCKLTIIDRGRISEYRNYGVNMVKGYSTEDSEIWPRKYECRKICENRY